MKLFAPILLVAPLLFGALPASADVAAFHSGDEATIGYRSEGSLYRSCRRKARKAYGPVRGRHSSSIRLAVVHQCMSMGGRLP